MNNFVYLYHFGIYIYSINSINLINSINFVKVLSYLSIILAYSGPNQVAMAVFHPFYDSNHLYNNHVSRSGGNSHF